MFSRITQTPAFWGLLGAIIYAAPKLVSCVYSAESRSHSTRCCAEALVALVIGAIGAAAFEPWIDSYLHGSGAQNTRAMSAVIGMLANSTAPGIIAFLGDTLLTRIRGGH